MTVQFGTALAREVVPLDPSALMAFAPAGAGVVSITLTTPDNRSVVADRAFTYRQPAPTLASISPSAGPTSLDSHGRPHVNAAEAGTAKEPMIWWNSLLLALWILLNNELISTL